jgi:hypothetical protein
MRTALLPLPAALLPAALLTACLLAGCAAAPLRPAPIAGTEPSGNRLLHDSHLASEIYAGPTRPMPWVPLEPTPGLANPAPEPFTGFNGSGFGGGRF